MKPCKMQPDCEFPTDSEDGYILLQYFQGYSTIPAKYEIDSSVIKVSNGEIYIDLRCIYWIY